MGAIRFSANRETNYVFHMLSVARCGYDNAYGARHRDAYPPDDLAVLKGHEALLTVAGGARIGALYAPLVMEPARGEAPAREYYAAYAQRAQADGDDAAAHIARVLARWYDRYVREVWPEDERAIRACIPALRRRFEETAFAERAERAVGCALSGRGFIAEMVASVENGPEGVDISPDQDVFGIVREPEWAFRFIGHEYIVFLLKRALAGENAFRAPKTWALTEGLADHYWRALQGGAPYGPWLRYARLYDDLEKNGVRSPVALYRAGLEAADLRE